MVHRWEKWSQHVYLKLVAELKTLPESLDFLPQEKQQIPRTAAFPKPGNLLWVSFTGKSRNRYNRRLYGFPIQRKTMCQNFLVGNLVKISLAFPLDFLAGKLKNTGSEMKMKLLCIVNIFNFSSAIEGRISTLTPLFQYMDPCQKRYTQNFDTMCMNRNIGHVKDRYFWLSSISSTLNVWF